MKKIFLLMAAITVLSSCSKGGDPENSILLASNDQVMYYDHEFQIEASSDNPITYTSENKYHAEVSATGLVTAGRVGETNIVLTNGNDKKKIKNNRQTRK